MSTLIKEIQKHIETGIGDILQSSYTFEGTGRDLRIIPPGLELKCALEYRYSNFDSQVLDGCKKVEPTLYLFFAGELPQKIAAATGAQTLFAELNRKHKDNGKGNYLPQVNRAHWDPLAKNPEGFCLYVGSCCKGAVRTRVNHHFIEESSTYGLHLKGWWKQDIPVKVFIFTVTRPDTKPFTPAYLNQMEEALWHAYRPLFGKKGAR